MTNITDGSQTWQQKMQVQYHGGKYYQVKDTDWEEFWVAGGFIYRGRDTSDYASAWYALSENNKIGSPWAPTHMGLNDMYGPRRPYIVHFESEDTCNPINSGVQETSVRLAAYWPKYETVPLGDTGQTMTIIDSSGEGAEVIRLDVYKADGHLWEQSFYARGWGLVGFVDVEGGWKKYSWFDPNNTKNPPQGAPEWRECEDCIPEKWEGWNY